MSYDFFLRERSTSNPPESRPRAATPDEASISGTATAPAYTKVATLANMVAIPIIRVIFPPLGLAVRLILPARTQHQ